MAWIKVSGGFPVTKSCEISQIEWIKCSDRLPNDAEDCYELVCYNENDDNPQSFLCSYGEYYPLDKQGMQIGFYERNCCRDEDTYVDVTHWMTKPSLPQPPK